MSQSLYSWSKPNFIFPFLHATCCAIWRYQWMMVLLRIGWFFYNRLYLWAAARLEKHLGHFYRLWNSTTTFSSWLTWSVLNYCLYLRKPSDCFFDNPMESLQFCEVEIFRRPTTNTYLTWSPEWILWYWRRWNWKGFWEGRTIPFTFLCILWAEYLLYQKLISRIANF